MSAVFECFKLKGEAYMSSAFGQQPGLCVALTSPTISGRSRPRVCAKCVGVISLFVAKAAPGAHWRLAGLALPE